MQEWKKLGWLFNSDNRYEWMSSHAMMPCVEPFSNDKVKVYFSSRDKLNRSRPASFILNMSSFKVNEVSMYPLLELGELGSFDDSGVMPTCIYYIEDKKYMTYNGWSLGRNVPFYSFNGIAYEKNGYFNKLDIFPNVLNRSRSDPLSTFAPFVLKSGNEWLMWYVSLIRWDEAKKHYYLIKVATSPDGINWTPDDKICIDFTSTQEYAIARPVVVYELGIFKMWYSYRASPKGDTYRIGYAESKNGRDWERYDDLVGLDISQSGWDSEMICYPYVFDHEGQRYMLYNGNGYGKTGIGLAVLEQD